MKAIVLALGFLMLSAPLAAAEKPFKWVKSLSGGSEIEIPDFFAEGDGRLLGGFAHNYGQTFEPEEYPDSQLRQYRTHTYGKSLFQYLKDMNVSAGDKVTYQVDKPSLAVISSTSADGKFVFYGMCQKHRIVTCFDIVYDTKDHATFRPIVEHIARSFRKNP
ncbi:exported hypothetical protein [Mesorhizobium plurifarium]|uniref:Uncharacterized protein n=1 Tax=Mesorhizobium plurifarium TaxID=69974 RepID=A0A0K2W1R7_MESPL|nr:exported hypothetical protein [Mesorhizobium plurifarium]